MRWLEDVVESHPAIALALGATAVALPKLRPDLSPHLRSVIRPGLSLVLDAESEAEGGIVGRPADAALKNVPRSLDGPPSDADRRAGARAAIRDNKRAALARARRHGWADDDRWRRYQVSALDHRLRDARASRSGEQAAALGGLAASQAELEAT